VPKDAKINKEEVRSYALAGTNLSFMQIFGPVVILHKIDDEEEALELANDSECKWRFNLREISDDQVDGLFGTIFTNDLNRALKFARRLESGTVGVNMTSPVCNILCEASQGSIMIRLFCPIYRQAASRLVVSVASTAQTPF
jgi:hypothetical protein